MYQLSVNTFQLEVEYLNLRYLHFGPAGPHPVTYIINVMHCYAPRSGRSQLRVVSMS